MKQDPAPLLKRGFDRRSRLAVALVLVAIGMGGCQSKRSDKVDPAAPAAGSPDAPSADASGMPVVIPVEKIDRVTLRNGLVIEEMRRGTGELCLPGARVTVRYSCRVQGGEVFDETGAESQEYALEKMIKGWQDGLPGMQVGGVRRLTVPAELGYGARELKDADGAVLAPANSVLVYEVELVGVR